MDGNKKMAIENGEHDIDAGIGDCIGHHAFDCASLFQNRFQKDNGEQDHNRPNRNSAVYGRTRYLVRCVLIAPAQQWLARC